MVAFPASVGSEQLSSFRVSYDLPRVVLLGMLLRIFKKYFVPRYAMKNA